MSEHAKHIEEAARAGGDVTTDCIFVAKDADGENQEVHAIRADMMLASPVFRKMLSEEWYTGGKVEIANFQAKTLRLVVEFVQNFEIVTKMTWTDLLDLIMIADYLEMSPLAKLCSKKLTSRVNVENIWDTVNTIIKIDSSPILHELCAKIIKRETISCLTHPIFISASYESILFLLKQDSLAIESERHLANYCWKWSKHQENPLGTMLELLPHLQLENSSKAGIEHIPSIDITNADFAIRSMELILLEPSLIRQVDGARTYTCVASSDLTCLRKMSNVRIIDLTSKDLGIEHLAVDQNVPYTSTLDITSYQDMDMFGVLLPTFIEITSPEWKFDRSHQRFSHVEFNHKNICCNYSLKLYAIPSSVLLAEIKGKAQMGFGEVAKLEPGNAIILDSPFRLRSQMKVHLKLTLHPEKSIILLVNKAYQPYSKYKLRVEPHQSHFIYGLAVSKQ